MEGGREGGREGRREGGRERERDRDTETQRHKQNHRLAIYNNNYYYYNSAIPPIAEVKANKVYRFTISSTVYFNTGTRGDVHGQNFRLNIAEFAEGVVVLVREKAGREMVFSAMAPEVARSEFKKEDQAALTRKL